MEWEKNFERLEYKQFWHTKSLTKTVLKKHAFIFSLPL